MIKHYLNVGKLKMDRDWWHSLGMLMFYYFFLFFILACISHVRAQAATKPTTVFHNRLTGVYYGVNGKVTIHRNGNNLTINSDTSFLVSSDSSFNSISVLSGSLFINDNYIVYDYGVFEPKTLGGVFNFEYNRSIVSPIQENTLVTSPNVIYYFDGDSFYCFESSSSIHLINNIIYRYPELDTSNGVLYKLDSGGYRLVNHVPGVIYANPVITWINRMEGSFLVDGGITLDVEQHPFTQELSPGVDPSPTPTLSPTPSPAPSSPGVLPLSTEFPEFNNYLDIVNYFYQFNAKIIVGSHSNDHTKVGSVFIGVNVREYDTPGAYYYFYATRYYIFSFNLEGSIFTRTFKDNDNSSHRISIYSPRFSNYEISGYSSYFDSTIKSQWPFLDIVFPSPTPSLISPTPSPEPPTPTPSPIPTNVPQTPIQDPNNHLPFGSPLNLPNWKDFDVPTFDFDNRDFIVHFDKDSQKLDNIADNADASFLGLTSIFPDDFITLLWFGVGLGIVSVIIKIIKE